MNCSILIVSNKIHIYRLVVFFNNNDDEKKMYIFSLSNPNKRKI